MDDTLARNLEWLRRTGARQKDIDQYPIEAWEQWSIAMSAKNEDRNPAFPEWMQAITEGSWWNEFSLPFPVVGNFDTFHNWFAEADVHEDVEVHVSMSGESTPTVETLRSAWETALELGAVPSGWVNVTPQAPYDGTNVRIEFDTFYVQATAENAESVHDRMVSILGPAYAITQNVGADIPDGRGMILAYLNEWMYG